MDPRLMALMAALQGQGQGPAGPGMPQANPGRAMSQPGSAGPPPAPLGAGQTLGPPRSMPGPLLSAAGMQPNPNDMGRSMMGGPQGQTSMRGPEIPQRQGDMMGPVHPTYDEPTTPIAPPIRNGIPPMARTPLGALLIPGIISGGQ